MSNAATKRARQRFLAMGEAATRDYLQSERPKLKLFQSRVAAAENVLKHFERANKRDAGKANG